MILSWHIFSCAFGHQHCYYLTGVSSVGAQTSENGRGFIRQHALHRMVQEAYFVVSKVLPDQAAWVERKTLGN